MTQDSWWLRDTTFRHAFGRRSCIGNMSSAAVERLAALSHLLAVVAADDNASLLELLPALSLQVTAEPLGRLVIIFVPADARQPTTETPD